MERLASGTEQLAQAREALRQAKTADELRAAQAVVLPLELGLSIEQPAVAIGRSVGVTCTMRTRYCKIARNEIEHSAGKRQLRNRAHQTLAEESAMLDEVLDTATQGGVVIV